MKQAYLTIDDAPVKNFREKIDYLREKNIQAIIYCLGCYIEEHEDEVIYAIENGHIIGNHSYDHKNFSNLTIDEIYKQIKITDKLINSVYSKIDVERPIRTFRFPYLLHGYQHSHFETDWENIKVRAIQEILRSLGYKQPYFQGINYKWYREAGFDKCINVDCTYDTYDWVIPGEISDEGYHNLETVLERIDEVEPEGRKGINTPGSNEIILMSAFIETDDFKVIMEKLLSKGLQFINCE